MATLEFIHFVPFRIDAPHACPAKQQALGKTIERLPQLLWSDHVAWGEANIWALEQAKTKNIKTVHSAMSHLLGYANWLESEGVDWWHFPARRAERCLDRFRGALVAARNAGDIAPSTTSARMSTVVRFYRWLQETKLLSPDVPLWVDRQIGVRLVDPFGFEHAMQVVSTDLAIPNTRIAGGIELEDGLVPLTSSGASEILKFAEVNASEELNLMLHLGFATGLRLGSILDLKLETIERASNDSISGWYQLAVGPTASPKVATKFGNSGKVPIPSYLLEKVRAYAWSTRRLKRQSLASSDFRDLLFLTRFGRPYFGMDSRAINVEMHRLRRKAERRGVSVFEDFHFHRTRATFATMLMRSALSYLKIGDAVRLVREACLHKNDATTLQYVKFIESSSVMEKVANEYSDAFMGIVAKFQDA